MTNEQFNKMNKTKKKILVAQDILLQIKLKTYSPQTKKYIDFHNILDDITVFKKSDVQLHFKKIKECDVCALGSCILSIANLGDNLTFEDILNKSDNTDEKLLSVFDKHELFLIEKTFEGPYAPTPWSDELNKETDCFLYNEEIEKILKFRGRFKNDTTLLKGICNNIIKNGEFKL